MLSGGEGGGGGGAAARHSSATAPASRTATGWSGGRGTGARRTCPVIALVLHYRRGNIVGSSFLYAFNNSKLRVVLHLYRLCEQKCNHCLSVLSVSLGRSCITSRYVRLLDRMRTW